MSLFLYHCFGWLFLTGILFFMLCSMNYPALFVVTPPIRSGTFFKKYELTILSLIAKLRLPQQNIEVGIGLLNIAAQPHQCGFFVPKTQLPFMVGWVEQPSGWPAAIPVDQLPLVCLPMIGLVWRQVFNLFSGIAIMNNHTPQPAHVQSLASRFNLVSSNGTLVKHSISFETALQAKHLQPRCKIKFDRFTDACFKDKSTPKPMLPIVTEFQCFRGSVIVQPKLAGMRLIWDKDTRQLYNRHGRIMTCLPHIIADIYALGLQNKSLDGELFCLGYSSQDINTLAHRIEADSQCRHLQFHIFDFIDQRPARLRAKSVISLPVTESIKPVCTFFIGSNQLNEFYQCFLDSGLEGMIVRMPHAGYESGKSHGVIQIQPFKTSESIRKPIKTTESIRKPTGLDQAGSLA